MTSLKDLSTEQIRRIISIKEQIEVLEARLDSIEGGGGQVAATSTVKAPAPAKRKYHMTPGHRRKLLETLARARAIRWAKIKGTANLEKPAKKGKRRLSVAGRAAIIAATKARWARIKGTEANGT